LGGFEDEDCSTPSTLGTTLPLVGSQVERARLTTSLNELTGKEPNSERIMVLWDGRWTFLTASISRTGENSESYVSLPLPISRRTKAAAVNLTKSCPGQIWTTLRHSFFVGCADTLKRCNAELLKSFRGPLWRRLNSRLVSFAIYSCAIDFEFLESSYRGD